ncbi:MAG: DEAD/DEAH box helicase [Bacteroidota bacterium]
MDGTNYHCTLDQLLLDERRDEAAKCNAWQSQRLSNNAQANAVPENLNQNKYINKVGEHLKKSWTDKQWLDVLQFALSPFAIARIHKIILEAIFAGHLKWDVAEWIVVVIEQDVPCAHLAIESLQEFLNAIFTLSGNQRPPQIRLEKVFISKEFADASLHAGRKITVEKFDNTPCDLLIDISMLRRSGLERHPAYPGTFAILRSARWFEFERQFVFAAPIVYREIVDEKGQIQSPDVLASLKFFLQNLFRKVGFRDGQLSILRRALRGQTVIGLLPTGGGKSLTYQLAALLQPGVALVIDPIRSLMKDQVDSLRRNGIDACQLINSSLKTHERKLALQDLEKGRVLFSFVSPERLLLDEFRQVAGRMANEKIGFSCCVIDEAHCVSEWGHDFRTAYLALGKNAVEHCRQFRQSNEEPFQQIPLLGLTATASFDVLADVERELQIADAEAVVRHENTVREEIQYQVLDVPVEFEKGLLLLLGKGYETFQATPLKGNDFAIREAVAHAKMAMLTKILKDVPIEYSNWNADEEIKEVLRHAWEKLFDDETRRSYQSEAAYLQERFEKISYPDFLPEKFFAENGGLVFAPHRQGALGVTEKFKPATHENDIQNEQGVIIHHRGEVIRDQNGRPLLLPPDRRKSIADRLAGAGFEEAIPENCPTDASAAKYVGTFMGASDEADDKSERIDRDSFRNQDWFLDNKLKLMVATKAFGMGIDKPNIRLTVHFNIPGSPESFVQESGRAGRDGKLSMSYILLNRQTLRSFGKRQIKWLAINRDVVVPGELKDKWFEEGDFKTLLPFLGLPQGTVDDPQAVRLLHTDRDILEFFHFNSFKGEEKEKLMLEELLTSITFPSWKSSKHWKDRIEKDTHRSVRTTYWKRESDGSHRLYLNGEKDTKLGYIDLLNWQSCFVPEGAEEVHQSFKNAILEEMDALPDLENFLAAFNKETPSSEQPGILQRLEMEEAFDLTIGFSNHLANDKTFAEELIKFNLPALQNVLPVSIRKALKYGKGFEGFCDRLLGMTVNEMEQALGQQSLTNFRKLYHARRIKPDTDKAIFRLVCIGVADDFTVYYRSKTYCLKIRRKPPAKYVMALHDYIQRYYSDLRARKEILTLKAVGLHDASQPVSLENIRLKTEDLGIVVRECLDFLIDFTYREIALKRYRAIGDMLDACEDFFLKEKEGRQGSFAMKEWLFLYFNSKYAKTKYEAKLDSGAVLFSLLDDTESGKVELPFKRILAYLDLMALDKSGSETDNIKHLRGAATRLLRDQPDRASLKLLKAFSYFVLGRASEQLFKEAQEDCIAGFQYFLREDQAAIAGSVEKYNKQVLRYAPNQGRQKIEEFLNNLLNILLLEHHSNWLKQFNHQFLNGFYNESTRNIDLTTEAVEAG